MSALAFELPPALEATVPAEERGLERDGVRLLVASEREMFHARFRELPDVLAPGDLLVVNDSATLPASVPGERSDGTAVRVNFATRAPDLDQRWRVVELRSADGSSPARGGAGEMIALGGEQLELAAPYASGSRLMLARWRGAGSVQDLMQAHGRPIRYGYVEHEWPLDAYQNVYARVPGSAEMPSAGRPFTSRLLGSLWARGIRIASLTLHAGVSSPECHEPPFPEQYSISAATAGLVNATRAAGGRVIAVGTTVVRALESAVAPDGKVGAREGWTGLVIDPERGVSAIDGLITGWHEPQASHLLMLAAIGGAQLLARSYQCALASGYLWHEFGDSHLILRQA